jgi:hypothetical protein
MAKDVITRFKLETTAYDSKLRDASKGLADYAKTATAAGKEFGKFTQANVEAARALGNIAPSANNAKDKVKELVAAYNELAKAYNALTKEQQSSDFGKAMADSLGKLKTQIADAKQELYGMGDAMKKAGEGSSGLTSMLAVFGGNMMTKAAGAVAGLASEMYDMMQQGVELARQGEGIRIAFERLGRGDILDGLREATHGTVTDLELMKAAVKFNDFKLPVEELGTMLAFAQQKAKDTGQSVDYMVDSIVTGLGRKSLMILDNLGLSASEIKEKMAETGDMTKAVGEIIREQMSKAGDYVETAADRAAQANVSLQNKMEELGRKFAPLEEASNNFWTSMKIGILDVVGGPLATLLNKLTEAGRLMNAYGQMGGSGKVGRMTSNLAGAREGNRQSIYQQQQERFWRYINPREQQIKDIRAWQSGDRNEALQKRIGAITDKYGSLDVTKIQAEVDAAKKMLSEYQQAAKQYLNPVKADIKGMGGSITSKGRSNTKKEQTELQQNQKRINDLTQKYVDLMSEASRESKPLTNEQRDRAASIKKEIRDLERRNGQLKLYQEQAKGKLLGSGAFKQQLEVDVAVNNKKIEELERQLLSLDDITIDPKTVKVTAETDEARQKVEELKRQIADLKDQNIMINAGMASLDLQNARDLSRTGGVTGFVGTGKSMMPIEGLPSMSDVVRQRGGNLLDDKAMKAVNREEKRKDKKEDKGKKDKDAVEVADQIYGGVSSMVSSLEQMGIELPEGFKDMVGAIGGVIGLLQSIMMIVNAIQAVQEVGTFLGLFKNGGIVPHAQNGINVVGGTHYSGDVTPILANAGEVVLNRSQVSTLASQLQGGGAQNMKLEATVSGEQLRFVLNNNGRRTGRGEYVQSTKRS